ncbi:unnamed protein product [Adineta ricciae]|uniref:Uncharacterized protein n=2 Tax=Adineta ricciae TaxID=249248 RepID=A0A815LY62_ADIRI|nr:unnamed protein product [Adineta ricciae]
MARTAADNISKIMGIVAVVFGFVALVLTCVGVGTIQWYISGNANYITSATNFFSYCTYDGTTGNQISCSQRTAYAHPFCDASYTASTVAISNSDCHYRMRNAAALTLVGIILLAFGMVLTLVMALGLLSEWFLNLIPGILLFLASLFMLAGLAEGARYIAYNSYSASLYEAGHLFTILSLFLSSFAGGRIAFACGGGK